MAGVTTGAAPEDQRWPDLVLFLGDQVYADETSEAMQEFIEARRGTDEPPGTEIKDFEEYAHLYRLAWSDPANRWLLSTLPTAMIVDDHDLRDDWNTSQAWRDQMAELPWWPRRVRGGIGAYWIYQHLGNLSPSERAQDKLSHRGAQRGCGDVRVPCSTSSPSSPMRSPPAPSFSYVRDYGGRTRLLVMLDSRCARVLHPGQPRDDRRHGGGTGSSTR